MFVYICCAGGMTSSLLCENIKKSASSDLRVYLDNITNVAIDFSSNKLKEFDIILGYGSASAITESFLKDYNLDNIIDLILISPQVRFEFNRIEKVVSPYNISVELIDMKTFGTMNGKKIINEILKYKQIDH